jgi:hypothetical protein
MTVRDILYGNTSVRTVVHTHSAYAYSWAMLSNVQYPINDRATKLTCDKLQRSKLVPINLDAACVHWVTRLSKSSPTELCIETAYSLTSTRVLCCLVADYVETTLMLSSHVTSALNAVKHQKQCCTFGKPGRVRTSWYSETFFRPNLPLL